MLKPLIMLMMLVTGCTTVSYEAICAGTKKATDDHVAALLADGGDLSVVTGQALVSQLDAGCGR